MGADKARTKSSSAIVFIALISVAAGLAGIYFFSPHGYSPSTDPSAEPVSQSQKVVDPVGQPQMVVDPEGQPQNVVNQGADNVQESGSEISGPQIQQPPLHTRLFAANPGAVVATIATIVNIIVIAVIIGVAYYVRQQSAMERESLRLEKEESELERQRQREEQNQMAREERRQHKLNAIGDKVHTINLIFWFCASLLFFTADLPEMGAAGPRLKEIRTSFLPVLGTLSVAIMLLGIGWGPFTGWIMVSSFFSLVAGAAMAAVVETWLKTGHGWKDYVGPVIGTSIFVALSVFFSYW